MDLALHSMSDQIHIKQISIGDIWFVSFLDISILSCPNSEHFSMFKPHKRQLNSS